MDSVFILVSVLDTIETVTFSVNVLRIYTTQGKDKILSSKS